MPVGSGNVQGRLLAVVFDLQVIHCMNTITSRLFGPEAKQACHGNVAPCLQQQCILILDDTLAMFIPPALSRAMSSMWLPLRAAMWAAVCPYLRANMAQCVTDCDEKGQLVS